MRKGAGTMYKKVTFHIDDETMKQLTFLEALEEHSGQQSEIIRRGIKELYERAKRETR